MSSLQSIMNLDEDQQDASSPTDKKDKDQATPASGFRHQDHSTSTSYSSLTRTGQTYTSTSSAPTITVPVTKESHIYYPAQHPIDGDQRTSSSVHQGKRPAEPSSATPTLSVASSAPEDLRRQSSTSLDSMDQYGYASSSSVGGGSGGGFPPNHPRRPMGASPSPDVPVRYTPITGRVSRAKKGVPVHICESCNPPKTFTRAEHLRRHQLSHQQPRFPCDQCDRAFHRQDLLTRHQQRHNQEGGDQGSQGGDDDERRESGASGGSGPGLYPPYTTSRGSGGASTPSSMDLPQGTPPAGSRTASIRTSPQPRGGDNAFRQSPDQPNYHTQPGRSMDSSPDPPMFHHVDYNMIPRTLFVSTQGLPLSAGLHPSLEHPPGLTHSTDYSPWTSDSQYSTHGDHPTRPRDHAPSSLGWQTDPDFLSAYPARRGISTSEGLDTMATTQYFTNTFPVSTAHMTPSHNPYGSILSDNIMPDYANEQGQSLMDHTIVGHHVSHQRSLSVRSHTPEISIATSGQMADTLVTPAPLPHRIDAMAHARLKELLVDDRTQDGQMGVFGSNSHWDGDSPGDSGILTGAGLNAGCGSNGATSSTPLPRSIRNAIPTYVDIYWERCHAFYPVVHRRSYEERGEDILRCAMAAMATQYIKTKEDRIRGSQLHDFAWQEAKRLPQWNLQVMQAVLLCELFARFRGRKALVRPSKPFEHLYLRVLDQSPDLYDLALSSNAATFDHQFPMGGMGMAKEERWRAWIEAEGRRRLLAACFVVDNHASAMHQQPSARDSVGSSVVPLTTSSDALWSANSADQWFATLRSNPAAGHAQNLPHLDSLCPEVLAQNNAFDKAAILVAATLSLTSRHSQREPLCKGEEQEAASAEDLRTPTTASYAAQAMRESKSEDRLLQLFLVDNSPTAHVYMALHHTPLHDLLAVSGESWMFSQKVLVAPTFHEHQKRLKTWVERRSTTSATSPTAPGLEGMSSGKATIHAAHALVAYLDRGVEATTTCLSDYWAMYVCSLIIWAFGQKAGRLSSSFGSSGSPIARGQPMSEDEALAWLRMVADSGMPEHIGRVKGRREASTAIVSMVKTRLQADCIGGRSRLYVDAVGVLRKLEEGVNRRWF